jgi:predicted anti-sigma-YlaC factor YlaD
MKHITEIELIDYVNGSVDPPQKAPVEEHLAQCESCRQMYEQARLVYDWLGDFTAPQVNDLTEKLRQRLTRPKRRTAVVLYNLTRIAATVIIAALAGYFAADRLEPEQQPNAASALKTQSKISFAQPARHIALAVSGETR